MGTAPSNDMHYTNPVVSLVYVLEKLRLAGLQKRSVSLASTIVGPRWGKPPIGRYCIRLAIMSTNIEYLVLVPLRDADESLRFK